jgi:hypothetical protein
MYVLYVGHVNDTDRMHISVNNVLNILSWYVIVCLNTHKVRCYGNKLYTCNTLYAWGYVNDPFL